MFKTNGRPKNWTGPAKSDPGQVKIITDYIRREFFFNISGRLCENLSLKHCDYDFIFKRTHFHQEHIQLGYIWNQCILIQ